MSNRETKTFEPDPRAIRPGSIVVPPRAVQQGAKGHIVWVVSKGGRADYRPVDTGDWLGSDWFITNGLRAGEQMAVDGALTLRPGANVTVKHHTAAPEQGASHALTLQANQEKRDH